MGGCAYSQLRKLDVRHHNALPLHCNTLCQFFHNFVVNVMEWQNRTKTHVSGWWLLCCFCYNFVTKIGDFTTATGVPVTTNLSSFLSISSGVKLWRQLDFFCKSWRIRSNILLKLSFENRNLRLNFLSEYSKIFLGIFNSYESLPSLPIFLYFCNWEIRFAVQNNLILIQ